MTSLKAKIQNFLPVLLAGIFLFLLLVNFGGAYLDNDLGWHLQTGKNIAVTHDVARINTENHTLLGASWVDHEWLANYLMFIIYEHSGFLGLSAGFAFLGLSGLALIAGHKNLERFPGISTVVMLALFFPGFMGCIPHLGVRVQTITLFFFPLLIYLLYRAQAKNNVNMLYFLPLIFGIWANLHGGFLIGLFVYALWIGCILIDRVLPERISRYFEPSLSKNSRSFISSAVLILLLSGVATLINPYGAELYGFLAQYADTYYLTHIQEWVPFYYYPVDPWKILYYGIFGAGILINIMINDDWKDGSSKGEGKKPYFPDLFTFVLVFLFFFLSLKSVRHFPLFFASSLGFISMVYSRKPGELIGSQGSGARIKTWTRILPYTAVILSLSLFALQISARFKTNDPFRSFCADYPCKAVEYLKSEKNFKELKLFNIYDWGGYLIWTLPGRQLFIDGRMPQYPYEGRSILEEYDNFYEEGRQKIMLEKHGIELVLMRTKDHLFTPNWFEKYFLRIDEEKINSNKNELREYLLASPRWSKAYEDHTALLFVKK